MIAIIVAAVLASALIGSGAFLLVQRETGTRASAHVAECKTTHAGRYSSMHCTGSWIVGGSLLEGGHVVVGTIDGAGKSDVGKTIEVTLNGDTAYTRALTVPLLLIGLGVIAGAAAVLRALAVLGARH